MKMNPTMRKLAMLIPDAGGVNIATLNITAVLTWRKIELGCFLHHSQVGIGTRAPTRSMYS